MKRPCLIIIGRIPFFRRQAFYCERNVMIGMKAEAAEYGWTGMIAHGVRQEIKGTGIGFFISSYCRQRQIVYIKTV